MNSNQIRRILYNYPKVNNCFIGVFSSDTLPNHDSQKCYPFCFIVNTAKSSAPGEHWIAIFVLNSAEIEYFDSYGLPPTVPSIKKFVQQYPNFHYNSTRLQGYSTCCGQYCTLFLIARQYGHPLKIITARFHANETALIRDISVLSIVNNLANLNLPLIDRDLLP